MSYAWNFKISLCDIDGHIFISLYDINHIFMYFHQVCNTLWIDFRICSSCWNSVPGIRYYCWSYDHWASSDNSLVVDDGESPWDGWGSLWLPFPMEPLKLLAVIWGVGHYMFFCSSLGNLNSVAVQVCQNCFSWCVLNVAVLIFMTTIIDFSTPNLAITHQLLSTWTGKRAQSILWFLLENLD